MWPSRRNRLRLKDEFERVKYCATFVPEYQYKLGIMYLKGMTGARIDIESPYFNVPKDEDKGIALIRKAAEEGAAMASDFLSTFYFGKENFQEGIQWLQKAAEQGLSNAQAQLGILLFSKNEIVEQDAVKGCVWLIVAATSDLPGIADTRDQYMKDLSEEQKNEASKLAELLIKKLPKVSFQEHAELVGLL